MARPRKEISQKDFENLCAMQCTLAEIASWFECSEDTIERWCKRTYKRGFADAYKEFSAKGKISLRRAQLKLAEKSAAMAIFLGKQLLGQRDNPVEVTHTVSPIDAITQEIFRVQTEQARAESADTETEDDAEC